MKTLEEVINMTVEWYWIAGIAAVIAAFYYWFFVK